MRIAVGAFQTSPITSILSECNILPLNLRREKLTTKYAIKLLYSPKNQATQLLYKKIPQTSTIKNQNKLPFYSRAISYLKSQNITISEFYTTESYNDCYWIRAETSTLTINKPDNVSYQHFHNLHPDFQHMYTAIKSTNEVTGIAVIMPNNERILLKLPSWYGLESAKTYIILYIIEKITKNKKTIIYTDSA